MRLESWDLVAAWFSILAAYLSVLLSVPAWQIIEACGDTTLVYLQRLLRAVVTSFLLWGGLYYGFGLYSLAFAWGGAFAVSTAMLFCNHRRFLGDLLAASQLPSMRWSEEIFPLQWRMGLTWASGYFLTSVMTPLVLHYHGAQIAGELGLALSVANALVGFACLPIQTSVQVYGRIAASGEFSRLAHELARSCAVALALYVVGAVAAYGSVKFLAGFGIAKFEKFGDGRLLMMLLISSFSSILCIPFLVFHRARKAEPFWWVSVLTNLSVGASTWLFSAVSSPEAVTVAYGIILLVSSTLVAMITVLSSRSYA
jgi:hypothetical protein